jgi:hypothetical protein
MLTLWRLALCPLAYGRLAYPGLAVGLVPFEVARLYDLRQKECSLKGLSRYRRRLYPHRQTDEEETRNVVAGRFRGLECRSEKLSGEDQSCPAAPATARR